MIGRNGYSSVPITDIVRRATVSNRVFYAHFETKKDAFVAAFDAIAEHLTNLISAAVAPIEDWPEQVIAALRTSLVFFEAEPDLARFCLVAPFTATQEIGAHCRDVLLEAVPNLALGRALADDGGELPASTEDSLLGGVVSQLSRSLASDTGELTVLLPDLVEFVLAPYLGAARARELAAQAAA